MFLDHLWVGEYLVSSFCVHITMGDIKAPSMPTRGGGFLLIQEEQPWTEWPPQDNKRKIQPSPSPPPSPEPPSPQPASGRLNSFPPGLSIPFRIIFLC